MKPVESSSITDRVCLMNVPRAHRATIFALLTTVRCAADASAHPANVIDIAKGALRARVTLRDVVPMVRPLARSPGSEPAIEVRLQGEFPTVEVSATPAYGVTSRKGRAVFLTFVTSYRAAGDGLSAHPISTGVLIEPKHGSPVGRADVELPVGEHSALALTISVARTGFAKVSFRHPSDPAKDLLVE